MARKKYKVKPAQSRPVGIRPPRPSGVKKDQGDLPFGKKNFLILGIGLVAIILGFFALWLGDISFSPVLLVVGYCILIPVAILVSDRKKKTEPVPQENPLPEQNPATESGD